MMNQFVIRYFPGAMSLSHSSWMLCEILLVSGVYTEIPRKIIRYSDYS